MSLLASHQVLQAVRDALIAGATTSADRVSTGRFHPVDAYPFTRVRHRDEDLRTEGDDITWPPVRLHTLQLEIDVLVQASADLDAVMADGALQVLQVLEGTPEPLSPLNVSLSATGISYQATSDGAASLGVATVRMDAQFNVSAADPTTIL